MPTRLKKTRKKRGNVCMGYGRIGKHRKHQGGRGNAGSKHQHRILFDKFHPGHFGKIGMREFHHQGNHTFCPAINVNRLWSLLPEEVRNATGDKTPVLDLTHHGIFKVLGTGQVPQRPLIVKARHFSRHAESKIKQAGGACLLTA